MHCAKRVCMLQISEYSFSWYETYEPSNIVVTKGIFKGVNLINWIELISYSNLNL